MKIWHKLVLGLLSSAFPLALIAYNSFDVDLDGKFKKSIAFDDVVQGKARELSQINLRIATVRGELLKFESHKREMIDEIATMRDKLTQIVDVETKNGPDAPHPEGSTKGGSDPAPDAR